MLNLFAFSQKDSIYIDAELVAGYVSVNQKIIYQNHSANNLSQIKLLNFVSAYKNRNTPLLKRKLEDRKTDLYYAKSAEQGKLVSLKIDGKDYEQSLDSENFFVKLNQVLKPNESHEINLQYSLFLPQAKFTSYGSGNNFALLKYFFIVPDSFDTENSSEKFYLDLEENYNVNTYYKVNFKNSNYKISSNLNQISSTKFEGKLNKDVEFFLSEKENYTFSTEIDGEKHLVEFGYSISDEERSHIEFYLPLQLKFIKEKAGFLPKKIFISQKSKSRNDFFGNDDIKFGKWKFQLFSDAEKIDMDYFSLISQDVADQIFLSEKNENHWLTNGIKTYLEIQYLEKFYKGYKLLGKLPEYKILGLKPLKLTHISKLDLIERYGLPYQYIMAQNLDQKIDEKLQSLSNFNEFAVSKFETGSLLNLIAEKMGKENFEVFLKNFIEKNKDKILIKKDFLDALTLSSGYSSEFLESFVEHKNRINFDLKSFRRDGNNILIKVAKNTTQNIPFKLETINENNEKSTYWYDTNFKENPYTYIVPDNKVKKITINDNFIFPESNFKDNYLYTKGLFSNTKKLKFKLLTDEPNPEVTEVYVAPKILWNNYDKFLAGIKFQNKSLFDRPFLYAIMPFYSSGTGTLTGSVSASYKIQPAESFYRTLLLGVSTSYFHYDFDLSYKRASLYANMTLNKNPRSQIGRNISFNYNYYERDLSPEMKLKNDYSKYNIWNLGFVYSESNVIKDKYLFGNLQLMEDYQKISAESYYRWNYAKGKKVSFRFFAGAFINNKTRNNTFDFGISRVSNYAFTYNLLAQSANSGILSQQYIIAEGGFKSFINGTANQFIFSSNIDAHAWKMFNIYADFGIYKNKNFDPKFMWDSGVKLKVIPDFLEVYFPVQSSLGFEPSFNDYGKRIRYQLSFNLNSLIGYFRRGWY